MALSRKEVEKVAVLARLKLSVAELEKFTTQLNQIMGYVEQLQELDTEEVEPLAHPLPINNVFRLDEVQPSLPVDAALGNAPQRDAEFYLVPPVLD
jgi:aspartyl-tRNA(Asn)/glutamyl-tRNA(Gln) amidotransferase subunit C